MTQSSLINVIFLCLVNGILIFAGIVLNALVILCLWKSSLLQKKLCYFLILILTCSDLIVVTVNHPSIIYLAVAWGNKDDRHLDGAGIFSIINNALLGFSSSALLIMNIERYLATVRPIFHRRFVTKKRVTIVLGILVALTLVLTAFEAFLPKTVSFAASLIVLATYIVLIFFINYKMFKVAMSARRNGTNKRSAANFKCASTCLWAVLCFFCCSVPHLFFLSFKLSSIFSEEVLVSFQLWASTAMSMDSTFNCLLFFWCNKVLRVEGEKILGRCLFVTTRVHPIQFNVSQALARVPL